MPTLQPGSTSQAFDVDIGQTVSVTPGSGGTMLVEYTTNSETDIRNGSATWQAWTAGTVSAATSDVAMFPMFARVTAYTTAGSYELSGSGLRDVPNKYLAWKSDVVSARNPVSAAAVVGAAGVSIEASLSRYGAVFNGTTDDSAAIQQALDAFAFDHPGGTALFPPGVAGARLESGLSVDVSKIDINFNNLKMFPIGAITAITVNGTDPIPFDQTQRGLANFSIRGESPTNNPGAAVPGQRGLYFNNPDAVPFGFGPSNFHVSNFSLFGLDIGEEYGNGAWGVRHYNWSIVQCNSAGIKSPSGLVDAYELPVYYGGVLASNINGIVLTDGQLTFFGSSIDYNRLQGTITKGRVNLIGCHVETDNRRSTYPANHCPWVISGTGLLIMQGGRLNATAGSGVQIEYMFDVATNGNYDGGVFLDRITSKGVDPSSGMLAKGAGTCISTGAVLAEGNAAGVVHPKGVHETKNMLVSGTFENGFPNDEWFVSAGGTVTSRTASTNVSMATGAAAARNGSLGLIVTKNTAAGSVGTADITVLKRIEGSDRIHSGRLWIKAPSSTASVQVQFGYFGATPSVVGTDVIYTLRAADTVPMLPTAGTITLSPTWQEVYTNTPYRRPVPGLPYVGFRIRVHNLPAGAELYIDDVEIHQW